MRRQRYAAEDGIDAVDGDGAGGRQNHSSIGGVDVNEVGHRTHGIEADAALNGRDVQVAVDIGQQVGQAIGFKDVDLTRSAGLAVGPLDHQFVDDRVESVTAILPVLDTGRVGSADVVGIGDHEAVSHDSPQEGRAERVHDAGVGRVLDGAVGVQVHRVANRMQAGIEHNIVPSADADGGRSRVDRRAQRFAVSLADGHATARGGQGDVLAILAGGDRLVDIQVTGRADGHRREDLGGDTLEGQVAFVDDVDRAGVAGGPNRGYLELVDFGGQVDAAELHDLEPVGQDLRVRSRDLVQHRGTVRAAHHGDGATGGDLADAHAIPVRHQVNAFGGADDVDVDGRHKGEIGDDARLVDPNVGYVGKDVDQFVDLLNNQHARAAAFDLGSGQRVADDVVGSFERCAAGRTNLASGEIKGTACDQTHIAGAGVDLRYVDICIHIPACGSGRVFCVREDVDQRVR